MTVHPHVARLLGAVTRRRNAAAEGDEWPRWQPALRITHPASEEAQEQPMTPSQPQRSTAARQQAARHHDLADSPTPPTAAGQEAARRHDPGKATPTWTETAERAYAIYTERGGKEGEADRNWYEAEQQLRERQ